MNPTTLPFTAFYIITYVNGKTAQAVDDRQLVVLGRADSRPPHITLMTIRVLKSKVQYMSQILNSENFRKYTTEQYKQHMVGKKLVHIKNNFDFLGEHTLKKFYTKKYFFDKGHEHSVGNFRKSIYGYISSQALTIFDVQLEKIQTENKTVWYGTPTNPWYGIPIHSYGHVNNIPKFDPHMSMFNLADIKTHNSVLYSKLVSNEQINSNAKEIIHDHIGTNMRSVLAKNNLNRSGVMIFTDIVFGTDTEELTFSWK